MPVVPDATIEITAFRWVPDFAKGKVRDLRVRWALEEAGLDYRVRLFDAREARPESYRRAQPFGQVPAYEDGEIRLFESCAIALHIAQACEALAPSDAEARARATTWTLAALDTIEPPIGDLIDVDIFHAGEGWARERRPAVVEHVRLRLRELSDWLGDRDHLEGRFTVGDLMMTTVLRQLDHTDIVAEFDNLARYKARCEARPAFGRAMAAHLAAFEDRPAAA